MERNEEQVTEIDLKEVFFVLLDNLKWIIAAAVICCVGAFLLTEYVMTPMYQSSTSVYIYTAQRENLTTYSDLQTSTMLANDCAVIVKSRNVTSRVIEELDLDLTNAQLANSLSISQSSDSGRIITITVTHPNAKEAQAIADSVREIAGQYFSDVMELEVVNTVETANLPKYPSSPSLVKNLVIGGMLGMILASGIAIVLSIFNSKIRTEEDVERYLGLTVLSVVPDREDESDRDVQGRVIDKKAKKTGSAKKKVK